MTLTITTVSSYIGGVVGTAALVFIAAFLLLLVNMMIKGEASYMQLARVSLFSYFPAAIGALLTGILMRLNDAQTLQDVTLSAAVFLTEKKGLLFNIAQAVNPFSIWSLVLMVVGTAVVTMRSKAAVAAWVVPGWLLFSVLSGFLQK
ncbi:YIP1 family protein [Paenibacillus sp. P26]|nr:YIP1 family protein [Paenibacillus sp. P26]